MPDIGLMGVDALHFKRATDYNLPRIDLVFTVASLDYIVRFTDGGKLQLFSGDTLLWEK